jgi:hypothetical protein
MSYWREISNAEYKAILNPIYEAGIEPVVFGTCTDMAGQWNDGKPYIITEWGLKNDPNPLVRYESRDNAERWFVHEGVFALKNSVYTRKRNTGYCSLCQVSTFWCNQYGAWVCPNCLRNAELEIRRKASAGIPIGVLVDNPQAIQQAIEASKEMVENCVICNGTGETSDAVQAWDVPDAPVPSCAYCGRARRTLEVLGVTIGD